MNPPVSPVLVEQPSALDAKAIDAVVAFVQNAGEVDPVGLRRRILGAAAIARLHSGSRLVGIAALKRPSANHRREVSEGASSSLSATAFPFELGWVVVSVEFRRRGHSLSLCESLLASVGGAGTFATSRTGNIYMHRTLEKLGFVRTGKIWKSQRSQDELALFSRASAAQS